MAKLEKQINVLLTKSDYDSLEPIRQKLGLRSVGAVVRRMVEYSVFQDQNEMLVSELALMDDRKRFTF